MRVTRPIVAGLLALSIGAAVAACAGGSGVPGPVAALQKSAGDATVRPASKPTQTPGPPSPYLPYTWNGLFTMQVFDNHKNQYGISPADAAAHGPLYSAIWGSNSPTMVAAWRTNNSTLQISMYQSMGTDSAQTLFGNLGHDLNYWKANHPDWILYECDQVTPAFVPGLSSVPLDISNPAVIDYILNLVGGYAEQNGYSALGFDLVSLNNDTGGPVDGHHGCGAFTSGSNPVWVQKFSGNFVDPLWASAVLNYLSTARTFLHGQARPLALWANNVPANWPVGDPNEQKVIGYLDVVLDEAGFARYGNFSNDQYFNDTVKWAQYAQTLGKGFIDVNEFKDATVSNAQLDYALATYVMAKEGASAMFVAPYGQYGKEHYFTQYQTKIGPPCAEMYGGPSYLGLGRYAYYRQFDTALALVNTSSSATYVVQLPHTYYNDVASGAKIRNPLTLGPNSGYLLTVPKYGCAGFVH